MTGLLKKQFEALDIPPPPVPEHWELTGILMRTEKHEYKFDPSSGGSNVKEWVKTTLFFGDHAHPLQMTWNGEQWCPW